MKDPKNTPQVGFVILSWNGADLLKPCLESLERQTFENFLTCLVDNGSQDDTQDVFRSSTLKQKLLIANDHNRGFAPAVNQGVRRLLAENVDYIVLLNNDVTLMSNWTTEMLTSMETSAPVVGFGQGSNFTDASKQSFDSTGIYLEEGFIPRQKATLNSEPVAIGPNAAALMMKRAFVEDMLYQGKLLDDRFFAYVEDVDLLMRAYLKGWEYSFVEKAEAIHIGSATGERISSKKMYWGARNMMWLLAKDVPGKVLVKKAKKIIVSHLADIEFLYKTNRRLMWTYCHGTFIGIITIPFFLRKRYSIMKTRTRTDAELLATLTPSNPPVTNPVKYILRKLFA